MQVISKLVTCLCTALEEQAARSCDLPCREQQAHGDNCSPGVCVFAGTMQRILAADIGGFNKAYELSNYAMAAAVPAAVFSSKDSAMQKAADWTLSLAVPLHMQITTNALVTDYVPTRFRGPVRAAILGASLVTYLGIMKVNLAGPGLTETVKTLWRKQPVPA